jgi:hypothetical protein
MINLLVRRFHAFLPSKKHIMDNNKVNAILESLNGTSRAEVPAFFYTRLKARMTNAVEVGVATKKQWYLQPVYAFGVLALLIVINAAVLLQRQGSGTTTVTDTDNIQRIASEYNVAETSSIYDLAIEK